MGGESGERRREKFRNKKKSQPIRRESEREQE